MTRVRWRFNFLLLQVATAASAGPVLAGTWVGVRALWRGEAGATSGPGPSGPATGSPTPSSLWWPRSPGAPEDAAAWPTRTVGPEGGSCSNLHSCIVSFNPQNALMLSVERRATQSRLRAPSGGSGILLRASGAGPRSCPVLSRTPPFPEPTAEPWPDVTFSSSFWRRGSGRPRGARGDRRGSCESPKEQDTGWLPR